MDNRGEESSGIISARGTGEGLVLRIDCRADSASVLMATRGFVAERRSFIDGNDVALEWVGQKPTEDLVSAVSALLDAEFGIAVRESKQRSRAKALEDEIEALQARPAGREKVIALSDDLASTQAAVKGLFGGLDGDVPRFKGGEKVKDPMVWDEPNARVIYSTLRSGQRIESEYSLIVIGDVNSGAELISGGDIFVLGTLRGVAHAGAYDEGGAGRVIVAHVLRPTQLRIGMVISRGSSDSREVPELARVEGSSILVEPYQPRLLVGRQRID
jgi:septum site-determining protein MinC